MESNNFYTEKLAKLNELKRNGNNPYPHTFYPTITFQDFIQTYENSIEPGEHLTERVYSMTGRVYSKRNAGNLFFYTIESDELLVQFIVSKKLFNKDEQTNFKSINKNINRGDIIGVTGYVGKSKTGELSLICGFIKVLSPCLHMIPKEHFGFTNQDQRYRLRSLDMIVNFDTRKTFRKRAKIISTIRNYLDDLHFTEVQTPVLWTQAGGANAKPFVTMHNDMKLPVYMRVAPELFLKELVIGGMKKVYELGPSFRNESMDATHNPEFYSLEFYQAYADYNDLISMCQSMLPHIV